VPPGKLLVVICSWALMVMVTVAELDVDGVGVELSVTVATKLNGGATP
jgi:hypothetical protein